MSLKINKKDLFYDAPSDLSTFESNLDTISINTKIVDMKSFMILMPTVNAQILIIRIN